MDNLPILFIVIVAVTVFVVTAASMKKPLPETSPEPSPEPTTSSDSFLSTIGPLLPTMAVSWGEIAYVYYKGAFYEYENGSMKASEKITTPFASATNINVTCPIQVQSPMVKTSDGDKAMTNTGTQGKFSVSVATNGSELTINGFSPEPTPGNAYIVVVGTQNY